MLLALQPRPPKPEPFYKHLLPPNSTVLERALARSTGRLTAVPVEISKVFHWETCPAEFLPWLAYEAGVDLWYNDWPEGRKREVIRDTVLLHQLKGTAGGLKRYCGLVDATVERILTPPNHPYWAPHDEANVTRWEATLPQIRIYPRREPGTADGFYCDADFYDDEAPNYGGYLEGNRALEDAGDRKVYYDPATDTEVEVDWVGEVVPAYGTHTELGLPGTAAADHFYLDDGYLDDGYLPSTSDVQVSIATLPPRPPSEIRNGWYRATRTTPDYVDMPGAAGNGELYLNDGHLDDGDPDNLLDGDYLCENEAPWQVYRKWHLYSPAATRGDPDGWAYHNDYRFGMPPHTAEVWVDIPDPAPMDVAYDECDTYLMDTDLTKLWRVADAITLSKAERDQILIETEIRRPATFGDRRLFGDRVKAGEYLPRAN